MGAKAGPESSGERKYAFDVFLSYAHNDNRPLSPEKRGWVDKFHALLENCAGVHLGRRARIWHDPELRRSARYAAEILERLQESAILVSIVSPSYLHSEWCLRELRNFTEEAAKRGTLRIGNSLSVVKALRLPPGTTSLPEPLDEVLGFEFFHRAEADRYRDLLLDASPHAQRVFRARVDDVAYELAKLLAALEAESAELASVRPARPGGGQGRGTPVFVASTEVALSEERDLVRRELEARGCRVIAQMQDVPSADPARKLWPDGAPKLTIHLIGSDADLLADGSPQSSVAQQLRAGMRELGRASGHQIVWLAATVSADASARFLRELDRLGSAARKADVLVGHDFAALRALILERLAGPGESVQAPQSEAPLVYLLCDPSDSAIAQALEEDLFERKVEVRMPLRRGSPEDRRVDHEEMLRECAGVVIVWGRATEAWVRSMLRDMARSFGLGRQLPFRAQMLCLDEPLEEEKLHFRTQLATKVHLADTGATDAIDAFVRRVNGEV